MQLTDERYELLLEKERAHDDYLEALRRTKSLDAAAENNARRLPDMSPLRYFAEGYHAARYDLAEAILDISVERDEAS